ncbi:hypothetical protein JS528_01050 [Bifidobacterium sp. MA2]|uniref:Uridine kinase n=1 Tax=Bifidobacterium santillanense TaxID=2809028 RepID=A0ABS5UM30_9BIFI|nr:hypothetical protein [Bifidobacterium santillanense]MBT1171967.1 hypothetical protein [Bifidobacterium santillanense]
MTNRTNRIADNTTAARTTTPLRRILATLAAGLCLTALAGCTSPFATDTANGSTETDDGDTTTLTTDATAKRFVACLTGKGLDAQAAAGPPTPDANGKTKAPTVRNMVELRMIDRSGNPIQTSGDGMSVSTDDTTQKLYANAMYTSLEDNTVWVAFKDSTALAGTPYESKRADYADCEKTNPDFTQPAQNLTATGTTITEDDKRSALDYARKARAKGFTWVADPTGDEPTTIIIPKTVGENELKRFLNECPIGDAHIAYGFDGTPEEFGYDYTKTMSEVDGSATSSVTAQ